MRIVASLVQFVKFLFARAAASPALQVASFVHSMVHPACACRLQRPPLLAGDPQREIFVYPQ